MDVECKQCKATRHGRPGHRDIICILPTPGYKSSAKTRPPTTSTHTKVITIIASPSASLGCTIFWPYNQGGRDVFIQTYHRDRTLTLFYHSSFSSNTRTPRHVNHVSPPSSSPVHPYNCLHQTLVPHLNRFSNEACSTSLTAAAGSSSAVCSSQLV